jgi:hypothetical protein
METMFYFMLTKTRHHSELYLLHLNSRKSQNRQQLDCLIVLSFVRRLHKVMKRVELVSGFDVVLLAFFFFYDFFFLLCSKALFVVLKYKNAGVDYDDQK